MTRAADQHPVIPEGELRCVWMDAGLVEYKLCDRALKCEACPFDAVIRDRYGQLTRGRQTRNHGAPDGVEWGGMNETTENTFTRELIRFMAPFRSPQLPADRWYTASHAWIKYESTTSALCGIDHLAVYLLGDMKGIVLPSTPCEAHPYAPCAWIIHREGAIVLGLPFGATIRETNALLREKPHLISRSPYEEGWMFRVDSLNEKKPVPAKVFEPADAKIYFAKQGQVLERELHATYERRTPALGPTMPDGGGVVHWIPHIIGEHEYFEVISRILTMKR